MPFFVEILKINGKKSIGGVVRSTNDKQNCYKKRFFKKVATIIGNALYSGFLIILAI